jgi:hypothetical protein
VKSLLRVLFASAAMVAGGFANSGINSGIRCDFEDGLSEWKPLWTREQPASGTVEPDPQCAHGGRQSARIEYRGQRDWAFEWGAVLPVEPGDMVEISAWLKASTDCGVTLSVSTWDRGEKVQDWLYAARSIDGPTDWREARTRFIVPEGVVQIQPRLTGRSPATIWVDDFEVEKSSNVKSLRRKDLAPALVIRNAAISVAFDTARATLTVMDQRNKRTFQQSALSPEMLVLEASASGNEIQASLIHSSSGLKMNATIRLDCDLPELTVTLDGEDGALPVPVKFPAPFVSMAGDYLVVPLNEGISFPVEDRTIDPMRLIAYGGHGICMAFAGATNGEEGQMAILETPDDAAIRIDRNDGNLTVAPEWDPQRGRLGYPRAVRYVFFEKGGHVAMAKRYRDHARQIGLLKTLEQKRKENPDVDLLVGAVNVWCWDKDGPSIAREMLDAGIERILWSNAQSPENLKSLNRLGILTSRYDIYQDVMNPENFQFLKWRHPDWVTEAWALDTITDAQGNWQRGWECDGKDGKRYPCGVLCDKRALPYARKRFAEELATHPYRCRFIDTTTATPWNECYDPRHPMTRTESRRSKMELLRYVSEECRLVTGSETGHDASVPFLHYFEGMLSLGPYRVPDSGRNMERIWNKAPKAVETFQLGHQYRLPLWELVFHDCVVAHWYWGDYSNKLPDLWNKRDLFNVLYGTPPMFMFRRNLWEKNKMRFVQSYKNTCPFARSVGFSEMTDHRFLTPERNVQQTAFANGLSVTVNFGSVPYRSSGGEIVGPMGFRISGPDSKVPSGRGPE